MDGWFMKQSLDLDFAVQCKPYAALWSWLIAACFGLLLIFAIIHVKQLKTELAAKSEAAGIQSKSAKKRLSPSLQHSIRLAHQTQHALNTPWNDMLGALEKAQATTPKMRLLSVQPNPKKAEIIVTGIVDDFDVVADYIAELKRQPIFEDAVLKRQQWEEAAVGDVKLNFILAVGWE